jgi:predicted unusual protein kinase regulating ubiquinone biosynthesis (AarF/ABC1/UbiB family)
MKRDVAWDNELSPEERKKITRQRRAKLGEEFLSLNRDSPFIFPPTWTFVFRAFFSIDGIGKSLNPQYDLTRLTAPYLKELLDLKDGNAIKTTLLRIGKRVGLRPIDINEAITQPRRTAKIEDIANRLERGDFKLRVRALDVERQMERSKLVQRSMLQVLFTGLFLQSAIGVATMGATLPFAKLVTKALLGISVLIGIRLPFGLFRINQLDKYNQRYGVR